MPGIGLPRRPERETAVVNISIIRDAAPAGDATSPRPTMATGVCGARNDSSVWFNPQTVAFILTMAPPDFHYSCIRASQAIAQDLTKRLSSCIHINE